MEFIEVSAKTVEDALTEALIKLGATSDQVEYEVIEKGSTGFLGIGSKAAVIKVRKKCTVEDNIREFLGKVFEAMELEVEIVITNEENNYAVDLKGADMGVLIGKRGQTLDSLQYLTNLAVNKNTEEHVKIKIDKIFLLMAEYAAEIFKISPTEIQDISKLNENILEKFEKIKSETDFSLKGIASIQKLIDELENYDRSLITIYLYEQIPQLFERNSKAKNLLLFVSAFAEEFLAAIYIYLISKK